MSSLRGRGLKKLENPHSIWSFVGCVSPFGGSLLTLLLPWCCELNYFIAESIQNEFQVQSLVGMPRLLLNKLQVMISINVLQVNNSAKDFPTSNRAAQKYINANETEGKLQFKHKVFNIVMYSNIQSYNSRCGPRSKWSQKTQTQHQPHYNGQTLNDLATPHYQNKNDTLLEQNWISNCYTSHPCFNGSTRTTPAHSLLTTRRAAH